MKGTSCCVLIRRNFKYSRAVRSCYGKFLKGLHDFCCYMYVAFVEFDTSVICHVFMHCLGSFLLHDMLFSLHEFVFEGQNMKFTVNILLTCILYCEAGHGLTCDQALFFFSYDRRLGTAVIRTVCIASTVGRCLSQISYLFSYVFLQRCRSFTSR